MIEQWKPYIHNYDVSNMGRVRNRKTGHILSLTENRGGYLSCTVSCGSRYRKVCIRVHVAVAQCFIENPNDLPEVNHIDGNKKNNTVSNLEWCSSSDNKKHAYNLGLMKPNFGETCATSKLKSDDIRFIREHYIPRSPIYGVRALAKMFGVSHTNISDILHHKIWNVLT